jgi:hypothetical protein
MSRKWLNTLLGIWWVSWLGIIGGFLQVAVLEVQIEFSHGRPSLRSLLLLLTVPTLWVCFFFVDSRAKDRTPTVVKLLTIAGSSLAALTLLCIWLFIFGARHCLLV